MCWRITEIKIEIAITIMMSNNIFKTKPKFKSIILLPSENEIRKSEIKLKFLG